MITKQILLIFKFNIQINKKKIDFKKIVQDLRTGPLEDICLLKFIHI